MNKTGRVSISRLHPSNKMLIEFWNEAMNKRLFAAQLDLAAFAAALTGLGYVEAELCDKNLLYATLLNEAEKCARPSGKGERK